MLHNSKASCRLLIQVMNADLHQGALCCRHGCRMLSDFFQAQDTTVALNHEQVVNMCESCSALTCTATLQSACPRWGAGWPRGNKASCANALQHSVNACKHPCLMLITNQNLPPAQLQTERPFVKVRTWPFAVTDTVACTAQRRG